MLPGIDISVWQEKTPSLTGLGFAFARATFGTSTDTRYSQHVAAFRAAGLVVGAYAFGTGAYSGAEQARVLLLAARDADLLALDLERNVAGSSMTEAQARDFIATVHAAGRTIGLYHSDSGFPDVGQDWNWVAKWGTAPPARPYAFWQWQGSPLDRDWFNGTPLQLSALSGKKEEMNVTTTIWPKQRAGSYAALTRRFDPTAPFKELAKAAVALVTNFDAQVLIDWTGTPHGTYLRVITPAGAPLFLVPAKDVNLLPVAPDPLIEKVRALEAKLSAIRAALA